MWYMGDIDEVKNIWGIWRKFKPKKTTDDCYTPPAVYEVIKDWAVKEYRLEGKKILRPFYPGGDYENFSYSENSVVIDNPPFSILSKIIDFYLKKGIKFFLFAPHLTLFSSNRGVNYLIAGATITYGNGAKVATSFITNMDKYLIRTVPKLQLAIKNRQQSLQKHIKYSYPKNLVTSTLLEKVTNVGKEFKLKMSECYFTRQLKEQKIMKKTIFGGGYLISDSKAKELVKIIGDNEKDGAIKFNLSDEEKQIVRGLE